jgi:predicted HD phosphohydrolase
LGRPTEASENTVDRFRTYELLLLPLENVMQSPDDHPEGDVLYHSLQVFDLARQALPYDEEFLLAALLHDVGKAVDRRNHVAAALELLAGAVSERTAWLIEHHVEALTLRQGTLGIRLRRRLEAAEDFDELMLLAACDRQGRTVGRDAPDVRDALQYVRDLATMCGESLA